MKKQLIRKTKHHQFKTTEEFLAQLDIDVARWTAVGGGDADRLYAMGIDRMFELFGHPLRIGAAPPYPTLLRMYEEALAAKNQSRARLLAECLRTICAGPGSGCHLESR